MDVMTIDDNGETANIAMTAESRLIDLERQNLDLHLTIRNLITRMTQVLILLLHYRKKKLPGVAAKVAQAISYRFIQKILIIYRNAITRLG